MDTEKMLKRLTELAARRRHLETEIDGLVAMLRIEALGEEATIGGRPWEVSWAEIGDALGVSRQAAQQLYARRWAQ